MVSLVSSKLLKPAYSTPVSTSKYGPWIWWWAQLRYGHSAVTTLHSGVGVDGWKWPANCGKCKHVQRPPMPLIDMPGAETAGAWLWCSEALSISRLSAAMSSRQLTRCTLLTRLDIMVSVKLLYSHRTIWFWLPHGCADQLAASSQVSASIATDALNEQIRLFLLQPNIPRQESALSWWRDNAAMFADIAAVAQRYLSVPATITYWRN